MRLYYLRLIGEDGPLWENWPQVTPEVRSDLRRLFLSFVERPFLSLYRQHAADYLALLQVA